MATQTKELRPQYQAHPDDPYHLTAERYPRASHRLGRQPAPPRPGLILSASIVGSGELIATTALGAQVGL